jgi:hypothetical protein
LDAAWVGREVGVRFPAGKPEKFRVVEGPRRVDRELARPAVLLAAAAVALVARAVAGPGVRWLGVGFCALWTLVSVFILIAAIREFSYRRAHLTAPARVTGRIVALLESSSTQAETGGSTTTYTPVVSFTTLDGVVVTGVCPGTTSRRESPGRELPLRYAPKDPSVFEPDRLADRGSAVVGIVVTGLFILIGIAFTGAAAMFLPGS